MFIIIQKEVSSHAVKVSEPDCCTCFQWNDRITVFTLILQDPLAGLLIVYWRESEATNSDAGVCVCVFELQLLNDESTAQLSKVNGVDDDIKMNK